MNLLFVISRTERWRPWNIVRAIITFALGIGLALVALVSTNIVTAEAYELSPWLLPSICLVYFTVLVLNHLPHPPPLFFKRKSQGKPSQGQFEHEAILSVGIAR
jgi:hypothetical protein